MVDMNMVIAENILYMLKRQNKKQTELADSIGTNKQTINKMLNGSRMINAIELKRIADFFGVKMEELTRIPKTPVESDIVHVFMGKVDSEQARTALKTADMLSDMILFHKRVRENGASMMEVWDS
jgi:transcriptional regulator with XRE-family HTH domain